MAAEAAPSTRLPTATSIPSWTIATRASSSLPNGENGRGADCYGAGGDDIVLRMPVGTLVRDTDTGEVIADLNVHGARQLLAAGGKGGLGNLHFKSSINRAPKQATPGEPGQYRSLELELQVLADVGLLGMPNAGKSTFITAVSNARPKIADYPFTTLHPHLGVVRVGPEQSFVLADVPGLIAKVLPKAQVSVICSSVIFPARRFCFT